MILAPSSALWLPEWFTEGKAQRSSGGKMKRNTSTGKIRRNSATNTGCCCGTPCSGCPTSTPSTWTLTTNTNVTNCPACTLTNGFYYTTTGSINGTFTLTQDLPFNPCIWKFTTSATWSRYIDAGCTILAATGSVYWSVAATGGGVGLIAAAQPDDNSRAYFLWHQVSYDCETVYSSLANEHTVCDDVDSQGGHGIATGGTVTVTPS